MKNNILAIIPAAGTGKRFNSLNPKQYSKLNGRTIIEQTISTFLSSQLISKIIITINKDDNFIKEQDFFNDPKIELIQGGLTRAESVMNALSSIELNNYDYVLTHDVARPNIEVDDIKQIIENIVNNNSDCSFFYTPVRDSIKQVSRASDATMNKDNYYLVQTPQICNSQKLFNALKISIDQGINIPDESFVMEKMNYSLSKVKGKSSNIKITYAEDLHLLQKFNTRTGIGYDLHTYKPGKGIILGGCFIECDYSINAHSDGDVLLHSIADAILGASALGDIGLFFADTNEDNKNLDSIEIINFCLKEIAKLDLEIFNIDTTIICETPKISPHRDMILNSLSSILKIDPSNIGLKATTSEKIGIIGENKAIAVQASVNLIGKK
ncbi:2-C-methyl-D-erythritol 4-phosphate cytidylyltransferase [Gammaproteobacteria bacterium]|nr:2-C-methyl-D-erythritol 4-phosphate cytidylyltransferase [Gammaproteobacteria bacterium]